MSADKVRLTERGELVVGILWGLLITVIVVFFVALMVWGLSMAFGVSDVAG
jgi:hypothetical protein